jgi:hypothetical protein
MQQSSPEHLVPAGQGRARPLALGYRDLSPQREDFQGELRAAAEENTDGGEQCEDQRGTKRAF